MYYRTPYWTDQKRFYNTSNKYWTRGLGETHPGIVWNRHYLKISLKRLQSAMQPYIYDPVK